MRITVRIHTSSSQEKVLESEGVWHVYVHAAPVEGRANQACIKLLAKFFDRAPSTIHLLSGAKHRNKVFELTPKND